MQTQSPTDISISLPSNSNKNAILSLKPADFLQIKPMTISTEDELQADTLMQPNNALANNNTSIIQKPSIQNGNSTHTHTENEASKEASNEASNEASKEEKADVVPDSIEELNEMPSTNKNQNGILSGGNLFDNEDDKVEDDKVEDYKVEDDKVEDDEFSITSNLIGGQKHEIDFILLSDKELINIEKVNLQVEQYIDNFRSKKMTTYLQSFKSLYQKYSNKRFVIHNIGDVITVMKNEKVKKKDIVIELKKPLYYYYDNDNNLDLLKRHISNERAELQYVYQSLVNKINVEITVKKDFENKKKQFIELLEQYYVYTLYHKTINNISNENAIQIVIYEMISILKDNTENKNNMLESNYYSIDKSIIDLINKNNTSKLNDFNDLISRMQTIKNIKTDTKTIESIKKYLNKNDIQTILDKIKNSVKQQNNYINYIIKKLP